MIVQLHRLIVLSTLDFTHFSQYVGKIWFLLYSAYLVEAGVKVADDGDLLPLEEAELDDAHYHRVLAPVTLPDGPVVLGIILLCR